MTSAKNLIPVLHAGTASQLCQHLPIPNDSREIEMNIRPDVEMISQRQEGHAGCHANGEKPLPAFARRPGQNSKRKK